MATPENSAAPIVIYQSSDGSIATEVRLEGETVWLSQKQMADLFGKNIRTVSEHIRNIFKEGELDDNSVIRNFRITAADQKDYDTAHYNLDVIISVGYRVKSKQGTQFRIWANRVLKDYLVQGYVLNKQRLEAQQENIKQLERTLTLFQQNLIEQASLPEARGLVSVITGYARTFVLLNQFDSERLPLGDFATTIRYEIKEDAALAGIAALKADLIGRGEASELFGNQKDDSFAGILGNIVQSFGGEFLYPSIEEQATHLLYFVIKNPRFGWQQAHRRVYVHLVFAAQPASSENRRRVEDQRQRAGGDCAAGRAKRSGAETTDDSSDYEFDSRLRHQGGHSRRIQLAAPQTQAWYATQNPTRIPELESD